MKIRRAILGLLLGSLIFGMTACQTGKTEQVPAAESGKAGTEDTAGSAEEIQKKGNGVFPGTAEADTVVLDVSSEPMELNSMRAYDIVSLNILSHCLSGITRLDANDNPVPELAERWEINDNETEITIYLRKDSTWSDGTPVTANDFYYSWVTQMKPETGSYLVPLLYENIKNGEKFYNGEVTEDQLGLEVIDDYTIRIEWERPMNEGLFLLSLPSYMPMNQQAYEATGADNYAKEAGTMLTNGPYKLTEWVHDDHVILEKSEAYFNADKIQIPKLRLVMLADPNTRVNAFLAGEIDLCNLYSEQIAQIKNMDESVLQSFFDGSSWYLSFNQENEYLKNRNLRKALSCSIDVQSLLDNVIADGSVAADGLVPGTIAGAGGKTYASGRGSLFSYDIEGAKAAFDSAMEELGITPEDLKLTFDVANTTYNLNQAAYIQEQWKQALGIEVTLNAQPWNALQEAKWNGDFNISIEISSAPKNTARVYLESFKSDSSSNIMKYSNPDFDALILEADQESDENKKQELMIEAEKILIDEAIIGPLYFTCTTYAVSDKLEGLVRTPFQYFNACNGAIVK